MREGATTYGLIEYCHKEHVTVFKIRFHFINGLDPERERNTIFRREQAGQGSYSTTDLRFSGLRQKKNNTLVYEHLVIFKQFHHKYNDLKCAVCVLL